MPGTHQIDAGQIDVKLFTNPKTVSTLIVLYRMEALRHREVIWLPKSYTWEAEKPDLDSGFWCPGTALVAGLWYRANWPHIHTARFPSSLTFCGTNKKTAENKTCFPFARPCLGGCTLRTKMFAQTTLKHRERCEAETYTQTAWPGLVCVLILLVLIEKN